MSSFKGRVGEDRVARFLEQLKKPEYRIGNNVILLTPDGKTVQFDHIVLSIYGIFVIETKNCTGIIVGHELDKEWYQFVGSKRYTMYNPIRQNYGHIQHLKKLLNENLDIKSIVCFTERCELRVEGHRTPVLHPFSLIPEIKKATEQVFTLEQVEFMVKKIREGVIAYRHHNRDHISTTLQEQSSKVAPRGNKQNYQIIAETAHVAPNVGNRTPDFPDYYKPIPIHDEEYFF